MNEESQIAANRGTKLTTAQFVLCALFTALIALGAFVQIPVPFMDYFTLQFLFVLLSGMLLGSKLGALATGCYVLMGLMGIPIFAAGGGPQYIFRPSFGYLLGFIGAAFIAGQLSCRAKEAGLRSFLAAAFSGMAFTYAAGFLYKYMILNFYMNEPTAVWAVIAASLPLDIPGDALLCILAAILAKRLRKSLKAGWVQL